MIEVRASSELIGIKTFLIYQCKNSLVERGMLIARGARLCVGSDGRQVMSEIYFSKNVQFSEFYTPCAKGPVDTVYDTTSHVTSSVITGPNKITVYKENSKGEPKKSSVLRFQTAQQLEELIRSAVELYNNFMGTEGTEGGRLEFQAGNVPSYTTVGSQNRQPLYQI